MVWNMPQAWIWRVKMISMLLNRLQDWRWPRAETNGASVHDHLRKCCSQRDFCFHLTNLLVIFLKCLHYWEGCACDDQGTTWPLSSLRPVCTSYSSPGLAAGSFTSTLSHRPLLSCLVIDKVAAKVKVVKCLKNHSHWRNFVKDTFFLVSVPQPLNC